MSTAEQSSANYHALKDQGTCVNGWEHGPIFKGSRCKPCWLRKKHSDRHGNRCEACDGKHQERANHRVRCPVPGCEALLCHYCIGAAVGHGCPFIVPESEPRRPYKRRRR